MSAQTIKAGSWVRVKENTCRAIHPEGQRHLTPWDWLKVLAVQPMNLPDGSARIMCIYKAGTQKNSIPADDVELITECICAESVRGALGCLCGHEASLKG